MMHGNKAPSELRHTIPLKCKLTVSTQNSILDPRSFRESTIEFRGSSFKFRFSRFENQVSRIEFRDNQRIFRGSWTEISRKRLNSRKQNNSNEQSNWRTALFAQINPLLNVCKYFFVLCIFYKTHAVHLSTLKLMTPNYGSLASKCVYNVSAETSNFSLRDYNPERVCCFHFRYFNWPLKT